MRRRTIRAHNLGHNAVTRVPRAFVYLDTETQRAVDGRTELQSFRLAVAAFDSRKHHGDGWREREWFRATDVHALWKWIDSKAKTKARTVLVAHNLAFDLRISRAFVELPALGWKLRAIRLDNGQAWCVWRHEGRTLVCVDSLSWVQVSLEKVGEALHCPKLALPDWDDDDAAWFARCERDVTILAELWRRLVAWVHDDDLGNWKPTGAGQSWAAFRHRFMHHTLLVHEDDDARAAERDAAMTGRCEAWRHGRLRGGPWYEWDYTCAYARIGAECSVPIKLAGELVDPTPETVQRARRNRAVLAEVEVTTEAPVIAQRTPDGIRWPIGTFATTVWDHELALAMGYGATFAVKRAWCYRTAPALRDFMEYVLALADETDETADPIVRLAAKHWSRALIGRTAAQWSRWEPYGRVTEPNVMVGICRDVAAGERFRLLTVGHDVLRGRPTEENRDALAAIMSWVMAAARVRLWDAMEAAGFDHVAYVDTDSLIVDPVGHERLRVSAVDGLRVKGAWKSAHVHGPRQIELSGALRASGIPRGAVKVAPSSWEGDVWSGLASSLRAGEHDAVRITRRVFQLHGTDRRRLHLPGGLTAPYRIG